MTDEPKSTDQKQNRSGSEGIRMMTQCALEISVPDCIIDHPETLRVFQEFGIDDSCGGKSLDFACRERGVNEQSVLSKLHEVIDGGNRKALPPRPT